MLQPSTELQLPGIRTFNVGALALLGTTIPCFSVGPADLGGFYAQPFIVPADYDRSRPGRLYAVLGTAALGPAAGHVNLQGLRGIAAVGDIPAHTIISQLTAIPAAWPAQAWFETEIGSASAPFFPGGLIPPNALLGIRVVRNGPLPGDTWTGALLLAMTLRLRYSRLCQHCDTCA